MSNASSRRAHAIRVAAGPRRAVACVLAVLFAGALLAGCTTQTPTSDSRREAVQGTWVSGRTFDTPEVPYVAFNRDRTWSASDGCNRVFGTWRITADARISVVVGPHAKLTCAGSVVPDAALRAETARVPRGTTQLQLRRGSDVLIKLDRSTESTVGPQSRPIGYWVKDRSSTSPYLSLQAGDAYRLYDGCTTQSGTWKFSNTEQVRLYPSSSPTATCTGDTTQIGSSTRGRVDGDTMTLSTADGTTTGTLHRFAW